MRTLSLFSGIGGLDLGLERAGFQIVAQCEQDPFCRAVLAKHWPGVPCFDDIRTIDPNAVGQVECVCGGFPCQDVSVAGKGAGVDAGARSGLWREMYRVIDAIRPAWVIAENVPALRTRGADRVLGDLEGIGYTCTPLVVGAGDVGAPHRRQRVFIVAHRTGLGRSSKGDRRIQEHDDAGLPGEVGPDGILAHAERDGRGTRGGVAGDQGGSRGGRGEPAGGGIVGDARRSGCEERHAPALAARAGLGGRGCVEVADATRGGKGPVAAGPGQSGEATRHPDGPGQGVVDADRPGQRASRKPRTAGPDGGGANVALAWGERRQETRAGYTGAQPAADAPSGTAELADPDGGGHDGGSRPTQRQEKQRTPAEWPSRPGEPQHSWEAPRLLELQVGSATDGLSPRLVRFANRCALRAAGNAVCPQVAEVVGRAVMAGEASR